MIAESIRVIDGCAVQRGDHVTLLDTGTVRSAAGLNLADDNTACFLQIHARSNFRADLLHDDPKLTTANFAAFDQLIHHALRHIRRNGKSDTDTAARSRKYL